MSHTVLCVPPKSNLASFKKASLVRKLDIQRQRRSFLSNALEARPPLAKNIMKALLSCIAQLLRKDCTRITTRQIHTRRST